jgi:hypothetical protein
MYLSSSDGVDGVDVDDNSQTRHGNTPPVNSNVCKIDLSLHMSF